MAKILRVAGLILIGIGIFVGLPLLGWGVADIRGFVGNPARAAYIIVVLVLQTLIVSRMPDAGQNRGPGREGFQSRKADVILLQLFSLGAVIGMPFCDRHAFAVFDADVVRYVGLVLFAAGFMVMHWAESALGRQFSVEVTLQTDHQLIMSGPYRYLRHPRYLGIVAFTLGVGLVFRTWLAFVLVAALALVLVRRVQAEEQMMAGEFGAEWAAYCERSWRLIPFVY